MVILPPVALHSTVAVECSAVVFWNEYVSFNYRKFMKTEIKHQLILSKGKVKTTRKVIEPRDADRGNETAEVTKYWRGDGRRRRQTEVSRLEPWEVEKFWTKGENDTLEERFGLCSRECSVKFLFLTQSTLNLNVLICDECGALSYPVSGGVI